MIDAMQWDELVVGSPAAGGHRNEVYQGTCAGRPVSIRRTRRSPASLAWELELIGLLAAAGLRVAEVVPTIAGDLSADGWIVQRWLNGEEPATARDWQATAEALSEVHRIGAEHAQRPECCTVLELVDERRSVDVDIDQLPPDVRNEILDVFAEYADVPTTAIHGDPHASNIRVTAAGEIGLLDFDESRVDLVWHDLSNLGIQVLGDADHARAERLSHAWEAANGWIVEPDYARGRYRQMHQA